MLTAILCRLMDERKLLWQAQDAANGELTGLKTQLRSHEKQVRPAGWGSSEKQANLELWSDPMDADCMAHVGLLRGGKS